MAQVSAAGATRKAARYFVSGLVQGVGYRFFARRLAEQLQLTGFAKNLRDGRVEVYAIGLAESLEAFREGLNRGPEGSMVSSVAEEDAMVEARFSKIFSIER
jgi:acylphosphatase